MASSWKTQVQDGYRSTIMACPWKKGKRSAQKMLILLSECETTVQFNFSWENMVLYHYVISISEEVRWRFTSVCTSLQQVSSGKEQNG